MAAISLSQAEEFKDVPKFSRNPLRSFPLLFATIIGVTVIATSTGATGGSQNERYAWALELGQVLRQLG
jgi:hypothetical protein